MRRPDRAELQCVNPNIDIDQRGDEMITELLWSVFVWTTWVAGAVAVVASLQARREDMVGLAPALTSSFKGTVLDRVICDRLDWQYVFLMVVRVLFAFFSFFFAFFYQVSEVACGILGGAARATGEWAQIVNNPPSLAEAATQPIEKGLDERMKELVTRECGHYLHQALGPQLGPPELYYC